MSTIVRTAHHQRERIRLLHVEDNTEFADLVRTFLTREDDQFDVETVHTAADGLARLAATDVDCIVSDYEMPGENGIDFLEAVREDHPDLPFILFTGKGSEEVASEAISAGATDYLQKRGGTDQYELLANRVRNAVEQYRATRAVKTAHHRVQELAESTTDCLWMFTRDWDELLFVSGYETVWNRPTDALEQNPEDFLDSIDPGDRDFVERELDRLSGGDSIDIEFKIHRGEAQPGWVWVKGQPVFDEAGNVVRVVGFTRDITERKEREREMERYLDLFEQAQAIAAIGAWEYDVAAEEGWWTDEVYRIHALPSDAESTPDRSLQQYHPADERVIREAFQRAIDEGEPYDLELRIVDADGTHKWVHTQGDPQPAADPVRVRGTIQDITARKERERELQETTSRLEALFDHSPDMIDILDTTGRLQNVNTRFCEELGYEETEVIGRPIWEIDRIVDEDDVKSLLSGFEVDERRKFEGVYERRDGSTFPVEVHLLRLDIEGDDRFMAISRDITERKRREEELTAQNKRLEEFASIVSHDLQNPLNVIDGRVDLARAECATEHLDHIAQAQERMAALIEDLLTLARDGAQVGDLETVDIGTLATNCWQTIATADATLSIAVERTIRADASRLQQLLENLMRNAVEHGGQEVRIRIGELEDGFFVEDDGPGIPEPDRDAVFDPGYSTTADGTGFGLSIVKQVANAHGWEVGVVDGSEGGTRFEITGIESSAG